MLVNPKRPAYRVLSLVRLFLAFGVLALFFCVYVSSLLQWSGIRIVLTSSQFTSALIRGGVFGFTVLAILASAALAGRWYCSVLCPFGTLQEGVWKAGRMVAGPTRFISPWRLRYIAPVLTGLGIVFAAHTLFLAMDPISNFGRGVRGVYMLISEGAASITPTIWAMLAMFAFILALAAVRGRRFCDWCPVGVLLGAFASVAPFGMRLRKGVCNSCGKCERFCPMNCIDSKNKFLDSSRCVLCLNCAGNCPVGALEYGTALPAEKAERRVFLRKSGDALAWLAGAVYLGGAAFLPARRAFPWGAGKGRGSGPMPFIMPPGAQDADWFLANCTGCQACAAACPAGIIRFGDGPFPRLDYTRGYCQYNCTECLDVCPTHALRLPPGMKQRTRIALVALHVSRCVALTKGEACGACAEVCAARALKMKPINSDSPLTMPVLEPEYCIGCGGCFHVCPVEPRAFVITGVTPQVSTPGMRPSVEEEENTSQGGFFSGDGFPF
ncbi:MAG: 4Fe-4S dicluster domain-containing protein [Synergistaceae bacterium]|nr:4Fe-4S dicluster domain-containing protein [Synergistaceae bacterium]